MPDKRLIYNIDENILRGKLKSYRVEFDAGQCQALEQELSTLKLQKRINLPRMKIAPVFFVVPLVLLTAGLAIYFNFDSLSSLFERKQKPVVENPSPIQVNPPRQNNNPVPSPVNKDSSKINTPVQTASVSLVSVKKNSIPETTKKSETVNTIILKKTDSVLNSDKNPGHALPVNAKLPADSITASPGKTIKPDTGIGKKTGEPVKRKRKRKNSGASAIDALKESSLQPNSSEDDIVVPQ